MKTYEINFDGLIGPTHNYAGLSFGNVASENNLGSVSRPKQAALQGLAKMKFLRSLGLRQGVLPPQPRPVFSYLRGLGFAGSDADTIRAAAKENPRLLAQAYSASCMWAANAATVSPSADTADGRAHFTPANLVSTLHRSLEAPMTARVLRQIFSNEKYFAVHDPLPAHTMYGDEGAANHGRFSRSHGERGVELFVYGRSADGGTEPEKYPARQTREACEALARRHGLRAGVVALARQNPAVIDAGVFHNDVISVANEDAFLYHEDAFADTAAALEEIERKLGAPLRRLCVKRGQVSVEEAVKSYLFNSQLVTLPEGGMAIVAPKECEESKAVKAYLDGLLAANDNPVTAVHYLDVRESMKNGGGPACLRLRVALTEEELAAAHRPVLLDDALYNRLGEWVEKYYRDTLAPEDLADPALAEEARAAERELERILRLRLLSE